ncbi:tyrosine-type recombinase/integrase [Kribbella karoonensis]|uniref:Tyr recombinase domain-containing protein n=1 Tax=Kribbella karoonensis TaxID=324851 RepID=A0ABP4NW93_9ACTN
MRRQVKRLGQRFVFALPKNDKERIVPMSPILEAAVKDHIERFGTTSISLPRENLDDEIQKHALLFKWSDGRHLRADLYNLVVWKPALVVAGVLPPPVKDSRGRRHYKKDRTVGLHALRHYYASITLADGVNIKELSEYLGHADPGFTLQMYTHLLLARVAPWATEQRRSRPDSATTYGVVDDGPSLL